MRMRRVLTAAILAAVLGSVWASVGSAGVRKHDAGTVTVLYAGSLVGVMEQQIGPAFAQATGYTYSGYGAGSTSVANQIKGKLKQGDIFISAAPSVNRALEGPANGNWVSWYGGFAAAPLVIGYNPNSKFASAFKTKSWWDVLSTPGLLLGRTDPVLDPKGKLTIQFINRASKTLGMPNLLADTLVSTANTAQIFPEETLVGRLQAGQLDAGFFYSIEAKAANIPYVAPPLGTHYGARYTITILNNAPNPQGALAFAEFLLGPQGTAILKQDGFQQLTDGEVAGKNNIPSPLKTLLGAK
jgi:molybdate/tungstate transport system substrate-binding protein